jgi:hypothetical protein
MFVEAPRDAKQSHLLFLRWLLEHEKIERPIAERPLDGEPVEAVTLATGRPVPGRASVPSWFGR